MTDDRRTTRDKLLALAVHPRTPPDEAAAARRMLEKLSRSDKRRESATVLSREAVMAQDLSRSPSRGIRVRMPSGTWIHFDEEDVDWEYVDSARLRYRVDGEEETRTGGREMKRL